MVDVIQRKKIVVDDSAAENADAFNEKRRIKMLIAQSRNRISNSIDKYSTPEQKTTSKFNGVFLPPVPDTSAGRQSTEFSYFGKSFKTPDRVEKPNQYILGSHSNKLEDSVVIEIHEGVSEEGIG